MAKLNCYCINGMANYFEIYFAMLDRKGYYKMPKDTWDKLRMDIMYNFEDRHDKGYDLDKMIKLLDLKGYKDAAYYLKYLKDYQFEDHKVTKISEGLIISLMGFHPRDHFFVNTCYLKKYYVKKFIQLKKAYPQYFWWASKEYKEEEQG